MTKQLHDLRTENVRLRLERNLARQHEDEQREMARLQRENEQLRAAAEARTP
jgi:hypothetical protein